jgi:type VI secretion system protein ImpK
MRGAALARAAGDVFACVLAFQGAPEAEHPSPAAFRSQILGLLDAFEKGNEAQQAPTADVDAARFALVAWVDELVNVSGWKGTAEWEKNPLQSQLFGTRQAGVEFFERLDKLRPENAAALEVYFYCLALGYQGVYAGRDAERDLVVRRTLEKLKKVERALDVGGQKRLTPSAYRVDVPALPTRGSRVVRTLLAIAVGTVVVFLILWGVLHLLAARVPLLVGG